MRYYSAWTRFEAINDHLLSSNESVLEIASISLVISSKAKKMH